MASVGGKGRKSSRINFLGFYQRSRSKIDGHLELHRTRPKDLATVAYSLSWWVFGAIGLTLSLDPPSRVQSVDPQFSRRERGEGCFAAASQTRLRCSFLFTIYGCRVVKCLGDKSKRCEIRAGEELPPGC